MRTGTSIIGCTASCSSVAEIVTSFPFAVSCSTIFGGVVVATDSVVEAVDVANCSVVEAVIVIAVVEAVVPIEEVATSKVVLACGRVVVP